MGPNERHSILKEIQVGSAKGESDALAQNARPAAKQAATVGSSALAPEGFKYCGGANMTERIVAELAPPPPTNATVGDGSWDSILRGEMDHTHCAV